MKKTISLFIIFLVLLTCTLPVAAQDDHGKNGNDAAGNDVTAKETSHDQVKGDDCGNGQTQCMVTPSVRVNQSEVKSGNREDNGINGLSNAENASEVRSNIRQFRDELNASENGTSPVRAGWIKNENDVRTAVHTLLAMENLTGGIGPQVSAIARDFNNSQQSSDRLEAQIQNRGGFTRFLFGGDANAATELQNITAQNKVRIAELQQLAAQANLDPDVRALYLEQITVLQNEQTRLDQLAAGEKKDRGLFGWL